MAGCGQHVLVFNHDDWVVNAPFQCFPKFFLNYFGSGFLCRRPTSPFHDGCFFLIKLTETAG